MLDALVLLVPVVRRVDVGEAEGPVCDGGLEQVGGEGAVEPLLGLLRPVPVKLHAVGLDGDVPPVAKLLRKLRHGVPAPAAGVEDAQRLPVVVVVAVGGVYQPRDHVHHPVRRGVVPPFALSGQSHGVSPFSLSSVSVFGPNRQGSGWQKWQSLLALGGGT